MRRNRVSVGRLEVPPRDSGTGPGYRVVGTSAAPKHHQGLHRRLEVRRSNTRASHFQHAPCIVSRRLPLDAAFLNPPEVVNDTPKVVPNESLSRIHERETGDGRGIRVTLFDTNSNLFSDFRG